MNDPRNLAGWSEDAQKAMTDNPRYFVWWYTAKSMALAGAIGTAIYFYFKWKDAEAKARGRR
jgi:hypothetical protein